MHAAIFTLFSRNCTFKYPFHFRILRSVTNNPRRVWTHSIRIECGLAGFALNAHFKLHSCRQGLKDVYYKNTKHTTYFQKVENKINGLFEAYIDSSVTKCSRKVRVNTRLFSRSNLSTCVVIYLNISFTKILINYHLRLLITEVTSFICCSDGCSYTLRALVLL